MDLGPNILHVTMTSRPLRLVLGASMRPSLFPQRRSVSAFGQKRTFAGLSGLGRQRGQPFARKL